MYFVRTPKSAQLYCRSCIWQIKDVPETVFITFDDGPDPIATPQVLQLLKQYRAKATFFCVGENAIKHSDIFNEIISDGHCIGNHSYSHLKGYETSTQDYVADMNKANNILKTTLLRPPYGKITQKQIKALRQDYKIIMWTVLPGDFDKNISPEKVRERAIENTKSGDIIVFHDNLKFAEKMLYALQGFLDHFSNKGFRFEAIKAERIS